MTDFNEVYISFFDKVQKDRDFFSYNNVSQEEAYDLAVERANGLLKESIAYIKLRCTPTVDFDNYDEENAKFNFDLTQTEVNLFSEIMLMKYVEKDFVKLHAFQLHFSIKDVNYFSPANERKTFSDMYKMLKSNVDLLISEYSGRDRITGKLIGIDYGQYGEY